MPGKIVTRGGQAYDALAHGVEDGGAPPPDDEVFAEWVASKPSKETQRSYARFVREFRTLIPSALAVITTAEIRSFINSLERYAPATRTQRIAVLKSFLSYAHEVGAMPRDLGRRVKAPALRESLSERILTEDAVRAMLGGETNPRYHAALVLLYGGALRVGELCGLRWRDVVLQPHGGAVLAVFGKGAKTRFVLVTASVYDEIASVRIGDGPDAPVCGLSPRQVERIVKNAAQRAGLPDAVSPHWLRHAHASHALNRGAPISLVQSTLGHANVSTTSRYLHVDPKDSSARYLGL